MGRNRLDLERAQASGCEGIWRVGEGASDDTTGDSARGAIERAPRASRACQSARAQNEARTGEVDFGVGHEHLEHGEEHVLVGHLHVAVPVAQALAYSGLGRRLPAAVQVMNDETHCFIQRDELGLRHRYGRKAAGNIAYKKSIERSNITI